MRFEFKHLTLYEHGVYITFGTRRVVITPEAITVEDYAGHPYVFRKSQGYSVVYGGPQESLLGRSFGFIDRRGEDAPIWFGDRSVDAIMAALKQCDWELEIRRNQGLVPRVLQRLLQLKLARKICGTVFIAIGILLALVNLGLILLQLATLATVLVYGPVAAVLIGIGILLWRGW